MQERSDKFDFQIILESGEVGGSSPQWQSQCHMLYDSIRKNLSEGSISPISHKGRGEEKAIEILSYDTLSLAGITLNSFYILLKLINVWERNKTKTTVKLKAKNGSEFVLSNLPVDKTLEIYKEVQREDSEKE